MSPLTVANALWDTVDESNRELEACFAELVKHEDDADYDAVIAAAAVKPIDDVGHSCRPTDPSSTLPPK